MKYSTLYLKEQDTTEFNEEQNRDIVKYGMVAPVECWASKATRANCVSKCAAFEMLDDNAQSCYLSCCSRRIDLALIEDVV